METADLVIQAVNEFYNEINKDAHGRYRSWEYCYYCFYKARSEKTMIWIILVYNLLFI